MERRIINCIYLILLVFLGLDAKANLIDTNKVSIQNLYPKGFTSQCLKMNGSAVTWGSCGSGGGGGLSNVVINNGDLFTTITNGTLATNGTTLIRVSNGAIFNGSLFTTYFNSKSVNLNTNTTGILPASNGGLGANFGSAATGIMAWVNALAHPAIVTSWSGLDAYLSGKIAFTSLNGAQAYSDNLDTLATNDGSNLTGLTESQITDLDHYNATDFNGDTAQLFNTNGLLARTGLNTYVGRKIAYDNGISLTNNGGVADNPRITQDLRLSTYTNDSNWSAEANGGTMRSIQITTDNGIASSVTGLSGNGGALRLSNNLALSTYTNDAGFLTGNQTITLTGDVTGSGTTGITTTIANSAVTTGKISNGAVGTVDLAASSVTSAKILNGTILVGDIDNGTHGYYMKSVNGSVVWATAGSSDAATLDGLDSTQFLRSDTSDAFTSGTLTINSGTTFDINSTSVSIADTNISLDGGSTTFTATGAITMTPAANNDFNVTHSQNGKTLLDNSSGSVIAILDSTSAYGDPSVASIFGDAVIQFKENGHLQWAMGFKANGDTFRIDDSHALANGRFVIKNDGNVGIGDTTPSYKLDVAGTINATGNITGANLSGTNTGNQTITLTGDVTGSGTGTFAATVASQTSSNWAGKVSDETGTGAWVFANTPTLVTPAIGAATGTSLVTTGKVVAGTNINGTTANFTKILDSGTLNGVSLNISNGAAFTQVKNLGNGGTTEAFDFTKANKFYMTTNASSCAISASVDPRGATSIQIMIQQRTGSQAVTWTACGSASGFCWPSGTAPTLTATASAIDIISCFYNPTKDRYYCQSGLDFR